jgi:hypothetical protein
VQFVKYVRAARGRQGVDALMREAGLSGYLFRPVDCYSDETWRVLVETYASQTGREPGALLRDFGEAMVPWLVEMYRSSIDPAWDTLVLLEQITQRYADALPEVPFPAGVRRIRPGELAVSCEPVRGLCSLLHGAIAGVATHCRDEVAIVHERCIDAGDDRCLLLLREVRREMAVTSRGTIGSFRKPPV